MLSTCTGNCELEVAIADEQGQPAPGVLVSLFKSGGRADEVLDNRYTDDKGRALIPASPRTPGSLLLNVRDLAGNSTVQAIEVK